jgi:hypothetical protein
MVRKRKSYIILVRKPEEKRPLGGYRRRCSYNIKMDHKEITQEWRAFIWCRTVACGGLITR